jgi:hypothetical protein
MAVSEGVSLTRGRGGIRLCSFGALLAISASWAAPSAWRAGTPQTNPPARRILDRVVANCKLVRPPDGGVHATCGEPTVKPGARRCDLRAR